jgi:hypothetical protein
MPFWVHGDDWRCDPVKAAGHFWVTWKSEGWGPWHGDIEGGPGSDGNLTGAAAFLGVATKAYQDWQGLKSGDEGLPGNPLNVIKDVVGGFAAVANTFKHFFEWIQNPLTWKILGLTIAGGILLLFGLGLLAFDAFKKEAPSIAGTIARGMAE